VHLQDLGFADPHILVQYLTPLNHSCSHLPFNQGTITKFKGYCTFYTLCSILDVSKKETLISTSECCISNSVAECTINIEESQHEMKFTGMDACFSPKTVNDFWGFPQPSG
jgi:hypothetical protein